MTKDRLVLDEDQCCLIYRALNEYAREHAAKKDLTVTERDDLNELIMFVDGECTRLQAVARRKAAGLFMYEFYNKEHELIGETELHNDGEAWEYIYKVFASFYPCGVTFEKVDE